MSIVPYQSNFDLIQYAPQIYRGTRNMLRGTRSRNTGPVGSVLATKSDVLRLYRTVRSLTPEVKYRDFSLTNGAQLPGNLTFSNITAISQGLTRNDRVGSQIWVKGIQIRGRVNSDTSNFSAPTLMVVRGMSDKLPTIGDFSTTFGTFTNPKEYKEVCHYQAFGPGNSQSVVKKNLYMSKKFMIKTTYSTPLGANTVRNPYYLCIINPLGGNTQNLSVTARVWFTDV